MHVRSAQGPRSALRARLRWALSGLVLGGAVLAFGACSAGPGDGSGVGNGNGGSGNGGSGNGGFGNGGFGNGSGNAGGNGGTLIGDGGGNGGSGNGGNTGDACASDNYGGKQLPLDMYLIVDRSGSMQGNNWTAVTNAITTFVNSPDADGIGVGLQFFPLVNEPACPLWQPCGSVCTPGVVGCEYCNPNGFLPPAVNIAPLPGVASQIVSAINSTSPNGGTPTMPALQSAGIATTAYAKQHPDRKVIIVLASDGEPSGCNEDINAIAAVAAAARASVPSVSTFTIGIGNIAALNTIAAQGGTGQAIVVDTASGGQAFLDAMNEIRGQALGCEFLMPTPTAGDADPDKLNVRFKPEGGADEAFPRVSGASQCQGQDGWYYDNPTDPSLIILCPASCDRVKNIGGEVNIELGCEQIIAPPR